ncbi:synaptotagmin-9-like isoform X3 [Branchiostoma lanceolatum]|uniref:synaptotagmin-9-like isoform X3 n=1 Tax=Branchiostoma lanceolatum TaxID=7740 RepID=UPI003453F751
MGNRASEPAVGQRSPDDDAKSPELIEGMARVMTTAKERRTANRNVYTREEQEEEEEEYNYTESAVILTQLFKKMDPAVMKSIGDVMGELKVSIKYKSDQSLLLVKVVGARDLSPKDLRGKAANAFVQVDLVPDPAGTGVKHTNVVRKSLNPTFNEIFAFPVEAGRLPETKLRLTVWNHDSLGGGDFMGERIVELRDVEPNQVLTNWYPLQEETDLSISGTLEISMAYKLPQLLCVTVHRASGLVCWDGSKLPHPFVRVMVPGISMVEQTDVKRGTLDPEWEQTYEFPVPQEEFDYRYVVLNVCDKSRDGVSMGEAHIDVCNFDPEEGYTGSFPLADMRNSDRVRTKWAQRALLQEFKEAMYAHSAYQFPKFLFHKHKGHKVVSVSSRKAGCQAKVRIIGGVPIS